MVLDILDQYASCYRDRLAVPCIKGKKSEEEKFAGAHYTTTVELYVPINGRGI
jgi:prolyl-tRNA synthetase